ncbi:hypothetical protein N1851_030849 [Merluccius polli]|uniref:Reverse transcriptase zinc-binding domain-containing protein n=1 Tax=Merluccius polli TaxID=89951 RepID=A0AA47M4M5_MERPO|nr:hypothetical protein N1851_030849 [Merluccius polli]
MSWGGVTERPLSWSDLWKIPQARLSFLVRSTYDTLPCPRNLHQWFGAEETCPLCSTTNASLGHILSGCRTALSQGRYRWRHDLVLRKLAEVAESCRLEANSRPSASARRPIPFTRAGENIITPRQRETARLLSPGSEWSMRVDLGRQLQFPREIAQTSLNRPFTP